MGVGRERERRKEEPGNKDECAGLGEAEER